VNRCTDPGGLLHEPCNHVNEATAIFCSKCGSYTAFYKAGLLQTEYAENKVLQVDEMKEMDLFNSPFFLR
jgi:hypothetical protein